MFLESTLKEKRKTFQVCGKKNVEAKDIEASFH